MNALNIMNNEATITSLELLNAFINPAREAAGENKIENRHFVSRIEDELEDELGVAENFYATTSQGANRSIKGYTLTIEQAMVVSMRESKAVRRSVVKQLQELQARVEIAEQAIDAISESKTHEEALSIATLAKQSRELLRVGHTNLTSVIQSNKDTIGGGIWCQSNIQRLASIIVLGDAPKVVKEYEDNPKGLAPRDYMAENAMLEQLMAYDRTLAKIETMADLGMSYADIKTMLSK